MINNCLSILFLILFSSCLLNSGSSTTERVSDYETKFQALKQDWQPFPHRRGEYESNNQENYIFLTIGYLSCFWCDKFYNDVLAKYRINNFKLYYIDRDKHPKLDRYFKDKVHALGKSFGYPANFIMDKNLNIAWYGNYVNLNSNNRLLGFKEILGSGKKLIEIEKFLKPKVILKEPAQKLVKSFKIQYPFFPLKYPIYDRNPIALDFIDRLKQSSLYDRKLGGFYRYQNTSNVDSVHLEKLAQDNLIISLATLIQCLPYDCGAFKKFFEKQINFLETLKRKDGTLSLGVINLKGKDQVDNSTKPLVNFLYQQFLSFYPNNKFSLSNSLAISKNEFDNIDLNTFSIYLDYLGRQYGLNPNKSIKDKISEVIDLLFSKIQSNSFSSLLIPDELMNKKQNWIDLLEDEDAYYLKILIISLKKINLMIPTKKCETIISYLEYKIKESKLKSNFDLKIRTIYLVLSELNEKLIGEIKSKMFFNDLLTIVDLSKLERPEIFFAGAKEKNLIDNNATIYICPKNSCLVPVTGRTTMLQKLKESHLASDF